MFLSVALWNGFPLIFYDTGAYVLEGLRPRLPGRTLAGLFAAAVPGRRRRQPLAGRDPAGADDQLSDRWKSARARSAAAYALAALA